jgi:Ca2+-binding RTX toxin-like protein
MRTTQLRQVGQKPRRGGRRRAVRAGIGASLSIAVALGGLGGLTGTPAMAATDTNPDFMLIEADLEHILKQIQIAEAHAAGGRLLCDEPTDTTGKCVPDPALPLGLRTVDGSFNNLEHPEYGSADRPFPRLLPTQWRGADPAVGGPPNPPGASSMCEAGTTCYAMSASGSFVYDAEPRVISNLIVDQTASNPAALNAAANHDGSDVDEDGNVFIPNTAPDEGLSAPFNAWFTFFGQFFDHGLDLVNKGGNGTLVVPLQPDDPLIAGPDGQHGTADDLPPRQRYLMLTRATRLPGPDGVIGTADDQHNNQTTPFIDQNQTYTSHPAHQVFLREYTREPDGARDTGRLLDGTLPEGGRDGLATWADVKAQARNVLGIDLVDTDVLNVPQVLVDHYGNFEPGDNGYPQLVTSAGLVEGNPASPISTANAERTNHAFLDDIAHGAAPDPNGLSGYDNVALDEHFVTGDGRGNENIGLTAVHHVFHAEHNRMAGEIRKILDKPENAELKKAYQGVPNDYQEVMGEPVPSGPEADDWSYEQRLFQAARFPTEMQYQHLVFEEFARKVQPAIDAIVLNENSYDATIDPAIQAEYAHVVYRFGHSMLTEDIERSGIPGAETVSLLEGFLNPRTYDNNGTLTPDQAAGAVVNGTTNQVGGQIDEMIVDTLRNNLLGLPLDLATINMVRARDAAVPSLQTARKTFFDATGDPMLEPYESWTDYGLSLKNGDNFGRVTEHPNASLVNFVAAYGKHPTLIASDVETAAEKRAAASLLVNGGEGAPADRLDFMNGTGSWASVDGMTNTGLEDVDFWIGGLAEALEPFGGMLGSTFNFVFEKQIEDLQFGDRFYYLFRNQGNQLFAALEANSFSSLIQRNTDASLLPADIFAVQDPYIDLQNLPNPLPEGLVRMADGTYRWDGDEHIEMHGHRVDADKIRGGQGDDSLWGYGGNDRIEGGSGNDNHIGGPGNDILTDTFGDDNMKGGLGNDAIKAGAGDDLLLAGHGHDFVNTGNDFKTLFAGTGDDVVLGGNGRDTVFGGEGDDWIQGGAHADLLQGDNANQFQNDPNGGNDVVDGGAGNDDTEGEGGEDVLIGRPAGTDRMEGMLGYDWVTYRGDTTGVDVDLRFTTLQRPDNQALRDRFDLVEGVSGGAGDDVLRGMGTEVDDVPNLNDHKMTEQSLDRILGLRAMLDPGHVMNYAERFMVRDIGFETDGVSNLLLGGSGSDLFEGRIGDDFLDGDAYLDVYLEANGTRYDDAGDARLQNAVFNGTLDPGAIRIVKEVVTDAGQEDVHDTAIYGADSSQYTVTDLGDGYWQVAHDQTDTEAEESEGSDILRNVELLRFADGCFVIGTSTPCGSYGTASIAYEGAPTEDVPVTGTVTFNNLEVTEPTDIRFRWMATDFEDVNGAAEWLTSEVQTIDPAEHCTGGPVMECSIEFTPGDAEFDTALRVEVTFVDDEGVLRSIVSPATTDAVVGVNDAATGLVLSTDSPMSGERVTVSGLADEDGLEEAGETLVWEWQLADSAAGPWTTVRTSPYNITGFLPTDEHVGKYLRAMATFTDDHGNAETPVSPPTDNPVKAFQAPGPTVPTAPTIETPQVTGDGVMVRWQAPADNGGSDVTGYRITVYSGDAVLETLGAGAGVRQRQVTGLPPGDYRFSVAATNAIGTGTESGHSVTVTVGSSNTIPGTPTLDAAVAGDTSAILMWTAPEHDGGTPITSYQVVVKDEAAGGSADRLVRDIPATASSYQVTGLTNGRSYRFRVRAVNEVGVGVFSRQSSPLVPLELPESVTLSGTVRAAGQPVEGAVVWAYSPTTGWWTPALPTDANGAYNLVVAPGAHKVYVNPNDADYPGTWYGGLDETNATTLNLTSDTTQDVNLSVRLTGTVRAAGQPVAGAVVWAYNPDRGWWTAAEPTGADGAYSMTVLAGRHMVYVNPNDSVHPGTWFGGLNDTNATVLNLTADTTQDVNLSVTLSGTVRAAGQPVAGAVVWAYNPDRGWWTAAEPTGADGSYSMTVLTGRHMVYVNPNDGVHPGTWYGGLNETNATVLNLTADTTQDVNLSVKLSGTVRAGSQPVAGAIVWAYNTSNGHWKAAEPTAADGSYSLTVLPGRYKVYVNPNNGVHPGTWLGGATLETATVVEITADLSQNVDLESGV